MPRVGFSLTKKGAKKTTSRRNKKHQGFYLFYSKKVKGGYGIYRRRK